MSHALPSDSVGLVTPRVFTSESPFALQCGEALPGFELVYETYGELNAERSNAVLVCHALSGHHHAAGYHSVDDRKPGWWDACIGPGKPIDTNRFHVVSLNNLGGCHGSTGPTTINPAPAAEYGPDFPTVTVRDWVNSQALLADHLGIERFAAVIGGSLGGMQALQWAIDNPGRVRAAVLIAAAARLSAQNIAFNEIARQAIMGDPQFHGGHYRSRGVNPDLGLMLARMVGHVTYLSDDGMRQKFGRELKSGDLRVGPRRRVPGGELSAPPGPLVLPQLRRQHLPADDQGAGLFSTPPESTATTWSPPWRRRNAASWCCRSPPTGASRWRAPGSWWTPGAARKNVASAIIDTEHGHDAFLLPVPRYVDVLGTYLAGWPRWSPGRTGVPLVRADLRIIAELVAPGAACSTWAAAPATCSPICRPRSG
jgi:homoserine O-acetyltransferase/O-succinyltransferase